MSFCSEIKNELISLKTHSCCRLSLVYGFMLFSRAFSLKRISMQTGNECVAKAYAELIKSTFGAAAEITCGGTKRPTYKAEVTSDTDRLKILAAFDFGINENLIDRGLLARDCCRQSFIRGTFLACGNINDPEKEYRAEFAVKNEKLADEFLLLLAEFDIHMKKTARGTAFVLYTKESGSIEDLLTIMGLPHRTLDIMDTKIIKSIKNVSNRRSNCDSGNISKTVEASVRQRAAIEYLEKAGLLESLPPELVSAARLRRDNPDLTLKELCKLSDEPLTVSGLNHRLQKITRIYVETKAHRG